MNIEELYTGIKTKYGQKIYLGDKLIAPFVYTTIVQYDHLKKEYVATVVGKSDAPFRSYPLVDIVYHENLRVINNLVIYTHVSVGDKIVVSVDNVPKNSLKLGEVAIVTEVNEWDITARSEEFPEREAVLHFGQFLEAERAAAAE